MKVEGETGHDNNLLACFGPDLRLYENCNKIPQHCSDIGLRY